MNNTILYLYAVMYLKGGLTPPPPRLETLISFQGGFILVQVWGGGLKQSG